MRNHRSISKDKLACGPAQAVVVSGLTAGLVAASLTGIGTASATCIGFSGINIGAGCSTSFGNFALGLGPGTVANATGSLTSAIATGNGTEATSTGVGSLAYAGGSGTLAAAQGILNTAIAGIGFEGALGVGTNVVARSGDAPGDFANLAINVGAATDGVESVVEASYGAFNLAGNFFGNANADNSGAPTIVYAGGSDADSPGYGTVAANIFGNRNHVEAIGVLNNATSWGSTLSWPNGSDSTVTAGTVGSPARLSWAFNNQGILTEACSTGICGNTVEAGPGPFAVAGAIGVINRAVSRQLPGINIATQFNDTGSSASTLAATSSDTDGLAAVGAQQRSLIRSKLKAASNGTKVASFGGSGKSAGDRASGLNGSVKKFKDSVKKFNDNVKRVTGGLGGAKAADAGGKSGRR